MLESLLLIRLPIYNRWYCAVSDW